MTQEDFTYRFITARRAAIALDFNHLNPEQQDAVLKTEGPLLILAGAGSGKTTVLINRIANLLRYGKGSDCSIVPDGVTENDLQILESYVNSSGEVRRAEITRLCAVEPVEPRRVIAITFTNKAAGELKQRLENMLGTGARDVWAMTFHAACVRILRRDISILGYDPAFVIYDTIDSQSVMKRIIKDAGYDEKQVTARSVLGYISRAKNDGIDAAEFSENAEKGFDRMRKITAKLYVEYERRCKASNALDFDDIILFTVRLLTKSAETREYYQNRFKYVLIDEYQDTNGLQYRLASLLTGTRRNICVVGDDDQSIYKFRGATIENILSFEKNYPGAKVIRLERNYRSTSHILDASNDVISKNMSRHDKTLWTDKKSGDLPRLFTAEDERAEARFVAEVIIENFSNGVKFSEHAILYRMNAQSNNFEYELKRNNIPYKIYGGTGFFERAEVKDFVAYLCAVLNPYDEAHLLRIINTPTRGIGNTTLDALSDISRKTGLPVFEIIQNCDEYSQLQKASAKLNKFSKMLTYLQDTSKSLPLDEFFDVLIETTGLVRALEQKLTEENLNRIENIREVKTSILAFLKDNPGGGLADFLNEIALFSDLDRDENALDNVALMTMHAAKGLEFDTVFIVGAEDGVFPGMRAIGEQEEMEEERRLCYVAMTRAKKQLFFVNARRRTLFGRTESHRTSCFVEEISPEHINRSKTPAAKTVYDFSDVSSVRKTPSKTTATIKNTETQLTRPEPQKIVMYKTGDKVKHKAFGIGIVSSVTPVGGDALLEVDFETAGTKRLMQKSASAYMSVEK